MILSEDLQRLFTSNASLPLVKKILDRQVKPKIDYLDLVVKGEEVVMSFLPESRRDRAKYAEFTSSLRQQAKIGKTLKKLVSDAHDDEIRTVTELIQGMANAMKETHIIVEGADVYKYYMCPRELWAYIGGSFLSSCYQAQAAPEYFTLFEKNPDKLKLLVGIDSDGKLTSRSILLIGELDGEPARVYEPVHACRERSKQLSIKYIRDEGSYYKQGYGSLSSPNGKDVSDKKFRVTGLEPGYGLHHWDYIQYNGKDTMAYAGNSSYATHPKVPYTLPVGEQATKVKELWGPELKAKKITI